MQIASEIEAAFQTHLRVEQLSNVRKRLAMLAVLFLASMAAGNLWPESFRYSWAAHQLSAQPVGPAGRNSAREAKSGIVANSACYCNQEGISGSTAVVEVGCAEHDGDDWVWCYVARPLECHESFASVRRPGAEWLLCGGAQPSNMRALSSTTAGSAIAATVMLLGVLALSIEQVSLVGEVFPSQHTACFLSGAVLDPRLSLEPCCGSFTSYHYYVIMM